MKRAGTVSRDTRSYRQGVVLGLTMAEVFLLLVFALLIALGMLWTSERQKRKSLEAEQGPVLISSAADQFLIDDVRSAIKKAGREQVIKVLERLHAGDGVATLTQQESDFIGEKRKQQASATQKVITDQWVTLTRVLHDLDEVQAGMAIAEVVKRALPNEDDRPRLASLLQRGLSAEKKGEHDWPPIINLSEAKGYFFERAQAELTADFERKLRIAIVPQLLEMTRQYSASTIEVIGHTDEQKIAPRTSNLDWLILDVLNNVGKVSALIPADNAGLGLARAAAVARILSQDVRMRDYTVLPLSAGQLISIDDRVTGGGGGDARERRRIEIRLRRANPSLPPAVAR